MDAGAAHRWRVAMRRGLQAHPALSARAGGVQRCCERGGPPLGGCSTAWPGWTAVGVRRGRLRGAQSLDVLLTARCTT